MNLPWSDFHFLRPLWLTALLLLPLIIVLWRRLQRKRDPWSAVVDPHLLAALREPGSSKSSRGPLLLVLLAFAVCVASLAGPAWQRTQQPLLRSESALIIALDLSDRSRATDLSPSRLARAKFKIADLLSERGDGQFALIAYAGDAFTVAPLTDDGNTLASLLTALDQDTLPEQGQRADRAIRLAARLLGDAGFRVGQLLLVTDSVQSRDVEAAAEALGAGLRTSVLGVGTAAGAPIALREGGFLRDSAGDVLLPKLNADALQRLAAAGGGDFRTITTDDSDLRRLGVLEPADARSALRESDADSAEFRDEGFWLMLILLPLVALLFRRGWVLCLPPVLSIGLLAAPSPAAAFDLESLWLRDDQRAWEALSNDRVEQARALAKDPSLRASAAYRQGDFDDAARHFAESQQADDHYNRGNALARAGRLQEAIAAYDQALQQQPAMEDANANREEVLKAIEEEQQQQDAQDQSKKDPSQQDQGEQDQSSQDQQGDSGDEQSESGEDGESGEQQSEQGDGQQGESDGDGEGQPPSDQGGDSPTPEDGSEPSEQQSQAFSDAMEQALNEQSQAEQSAADKAGEEGEETRPMPSAEEVEAMEQKQKIEQLLRRVPDDPGGLLRRKFALEARRRQQEGRDDE